MLAADFGRINEVRVEVVELRVDLLERRPMLRIRHFEQSGQFVVAGQVEDESQDVVVVVAQQQRIDGLALVEPFGLVAFGVEGGHDHVDVVVAQPQDGLVRVYPLVRTQLAADLVQGGFGESVRVLEEVVEHVQGAHLSRLLLVVNIHALIPRFNKRQQNNKYNGIENWREYSKRNEILACDKLTK